MREWSSGNGKSRQLTHQVLAKLSRKQVSIPADMEIMPMICLSAHLIIVLMENATPAQVMLGINES